MGREPILLEVPEQRERRVEESKPAIGSINRDRNGDALQHRRMRGDVALQLGLDAFEVGQVSGKAEQLTARELARWRERRLLQLEEPARAADHDMAVLDRGLIAIPRLRGKRLAGPGAG